MNPNYKKLLDKAKLTVNPGNQRNVENFADMLIDECIAICEQAMAQRSSMFSESYADGRRMGIEVVVNSIKEHFNRN
jgi:hypothetical protein